MTKSKLEDEIREIEAQLKDVKKQGKVNRQQAEDEMESNNQHSAAEDAGLISDEELSALKSMLAEFDAEELIESMSTHASAWLGTLNEDLKNTKPSTLLTVFGLGVIVGRLTK